MKELMNLDSQDITAFFKHHKLTYTVLAKQLGISRVTLNISVKTFKEKGECVNKKCMVLLTELKKSNIKSRSLIYCKIEQIKMLFDSIDLLYNTIASHDLNIVRDTVESLNLILLGDFHNDQIDNALKGLSKASGRYSGHDNKILNNLIGSHVTMSTNFFNSVFRKTTNRDKKTKGLRREIPILQQSKYQNKIIPDQEQNKERNVQKHGKKNWNIKKYNIGKIVVGEISEVLKHGCILKFNDTTGYISNSELELSYRRIDNYVGQKAKGKVEKIMGRNIYLDSIDYI